MSRYGLAFCLFAFGCATAEPGGSVVGNWATTTEPIYRLTLADDRSYTLQLPTDRVEGRWLLRGDRLTLTPKTINGMTEDEAFLKSNKEIMETGRSTIDVQKAMAQWELTLSADGSRLTSSGKGAGIAPVAAEFRRE